MRRFIVLVAGVVLAAGTLSACLGGPPPEPQDPHDVLVVGDSVSFSLGCALGDCAGCPARPGYSTHNEFTGGCTITPRTLDLYNGGTAPAPNCDTAPDAEGRTWANAADHYTPRVVVINTAGWEIVDGWLSFTQPPDYQWGAPGCTPQNVCSPFYANAAQHYSAQLFDTINMFRSKGATVVVAKSPYIQPLQPEPPNDGSVPADLACSWWEAYQSSAPTAQGSPGNPLTCPGTWRSPPNTAGVTYRSSKTKIDQLNTIVDFVKSQYFGGDPGVVLFNFAKHFNPGGQYNDYVCPPPDDATQVPGPDINLDGTPNCPTVTQPLREAILARAVDHSQIQILQPYLEGCVKTLLGQANTPADCN